MVDKKIVALGVFAMAIALLYMTGNLPLETLTECKNVYCNDFNFICCAEDVGNPQVIGSVKSQKGDYAIGCPSAASRCTIATLETVELYESCTLKTSIFGLTYWVCRNKLREGTNLEYSPGQWAYSKYYFSEKVFMLKLFDCGGSACAYQATGIPLTTSGCSWVTDTRIYDQNGALIKDPTGSYEFTVPPGACYLYTSGNLRRVCGDTCEQCDTDSDCISGHTYKYNDYGAECQSSQLLLYGCRQYGSTCLDKDILPTGQEICIGNYATDSRCELVSSNPVGCCPQTDYCGVNAFCDPETFTCKSGGQVDCMYDYDCGVATACDFASKTLKKPVCQLGKCVTETVQSVDCCYDVNCPSGWYCGADYKCYEQVGQKSQCPYECCEREPLYFDKSCPPDKQCIDHKCVGQGGNGIIKQSIWAMIVAVLAGGFMFLSSGGISSYQDREYDALGLSAIMAVGIGFAAWWFITNIYTILAGSIVLTLLGGLLLWIFGPALIFIAYVIGAIVKGVKG